MSIKPGDRIDFDVYGGTTFAFDPTEWTNCESVRELEDQMTERAEDSVCYGVEPCGFTFAELWEHVKEAKEKEEEEDV